MTFDELLIFEMANNHQGDVGHGRKIIDAMGNIAREYGVRGAIKFQYRDLATFIHPSFRDDRNVKHIPRFLATELEEKNFRSLIAAAREAGLIPVCTPFDEVSVQRCL